MSDPDRWVLVQLLVVTLLVIWGLSVFMEYAVYWLARYFRGKR